MMKGEVVHGKMSVRRGRPRALDATAVRAAFIAVRTAGCQGLLTALLIEMTAGSWAWRTILWRYRRLQRWTLVAPAFN
jgi:hypothetical protein